MDEFVPVSIELQGNIINERRSDAAELRTSRSLCFFLDLIFASFKNTFADVTPESLVAPLSSIPRVARRSSSSYKYISGTESVELYDKENKRWQWMLPLTEPATKQPSPATKTVLKDPELLTSEGQVALFLNTIGDSFATSRAGLAGENVALGRRRQWLAKLCTSSLSSSTSCIPKLDLVLVDRGMSPDDVELINVAATAEYTMETFQPASRIEETIETKAYLILADQPWRRFILGLSIANSELRVHLYDHSGGAISPPFNVHTDAQQVLFIIAAFAFGCDASIGFDSTIEIDLVLLTERRRSACKNILSTADATADDSDDDPDTVEVPRPSPLPTKPLLPTLQEPLQPPLERPISPPPTESVEKSLRLASPGIIGAAPSLLPERISVIGKIRVDDVYYDIIDILFTGPDFVGRGTVCYLTRLEGVYYVVKDQWVRNLSRGGCDAMMINEAKMMQYVKDVDGVPKLHKAWIVEVEEVVSDRTARYREEKFRSKMQSPRTHVRLAMTPCARHLTMFRSKKELVKCIRDILHIVEQALELGVLHRDCSLNNAMIEDLPNNTSRGLLLDWEFAVEITKREQYSVVGTGTLPFLSVNILRQLQPVFAKSSAMTAQSICKTTSLTGVSVKDTIRHTYADDVESLFYVLVWIIVLYDGPHGQRRDIDQERIFLALWSSEEAASDLMIACSAKFTFLVDPDSETTLDISVAPYFRDLVPLVHQWRLLHRNALLTKTPVQISDVADVLNDFIATMPDEPPAEITSNQTRYQSSPVPIDTSFDSSKRLCIEVLTKHGKQQTL